MMNDVVLKNNPNDKKRWALSVILGMLVLLWRVVIPSNVDFTVGIGALILALDFCLTAALIFINKNELKEAFSRKFTLKDFLITVFLFIIMYVVSIVVFIIFYTMGTELSAPAKVVGKQFSTVFPIGAAISMIFTAPIWEEIAFRMAGKNLIKNKFLYVIITSLLFAFIHTVNFSVVDNIDYFIAGVIFCVAYLKTKDIRIVMGAHLLGNVVSVITGFLAK